MAYVNGTVRAVIPVVCSFTRRQANYANVSNAKDFLNGENHAGLEPLLAE